jgi:hypothetical protein
MPVERTEKTLLIVNGKAAKDLGIAIPPQVRARASNEGLLRVPLRVKLGKTHCEQMLSALLPTLDINPRLSFPAE